MSDFEDKLNNILSSPDDMEKIFNLARSLSDSMGTSSEASHSEESSAGNSLSALGDFDPKMLRMISRLISEYNSAGSDKQQLMNALKPYLKQDRQQKIDKAVQIAKLAHIAKTAFAEFSGGDKNI